MPSRCVFCGSVGPLTDEHVWPAWLARDFAALGQSKQSLTRNRQRRSWTAPPASAVVKTVCAPCNNGWMASVEAATQPVIRRLMWANPTEISATDAVQLGVWTMKTVLVAQGANPRQSVLPPTAFKAFFESQVPDQSVRIWAGHSKLRPVENELAPIFELYVSARQTTFHRIDATSGRIGPSEDIRHPAMVSLRVALLVTQLLFDWPPGDRTVDAPDVLVRVWPPPSGNFAWPPAFSVPPDMRSFTNRIFDRGLHLADEDMHQGPWPPSEPLAW